MDKHYVKNNILPTLVLDNDETRIIAVRPVKVAEGEPATVQYVFAEKIIKEGRSEQDIIGEFMRGHSSFNNSYLTVWQPMVLENAERLLGEKAHQAGVEAIEADDYVELNISNPSMAGQRLRVQVTETHAPTAREVKDLEMNAKQDGNGNYLTANGMLIFRRVGLALQGDRSNVFIQHDSTLVNVEDGDFVEPTQQPSANTEADKSAKDAQDKQKELVEK